MTEILHLAGEPDLDRILPMAAAFHAEEGLDLSDEHRLNALLPLLKGEPHGAIWLIGPKISPVGYIVVCFGWSIEFGGLDAIIDEVWIREKVRGRGMGGEVLRVLTANLSAAGVRAVHLEVGGDNPKAERLYRRAGFRKRDGYHLMSWIA